MDAGSKFRKAGAEADQGKLLMFHLISSRIMSSLFILLFQQAPWTPKIDDPLDISNFESFDDDGGFGKGKKPLTPEEQLVFQDF